MKICSYCIYQKEKSSIYCKNCKYKSSAGELLNTDFITPPSVIGLPRENSTRRTNYPFLDNNWTSKWKRIASDSSAVRHGIILTNTEKCPEELKGEYKKILDDFIAYKLNKKTMYCVLDMANQSVLGRSASVAGNNVTFIVDVLKKIYEVAPIEYLLIVGDRNAIDSIKWNNGLYSEDGNGDRDRYVDSDIPYVFLDTKSLFDGKPTDKSICVGRVSSSAETGFPEAKAYFANTMKYLDESKKINACSLSAEEWKNVSLMNFAGAKPKIYSCPPYSFVEGVGLSCIPRSTPYNLLCFNLHGAPIQNIWASGDGSIAMTPSSLPSDPNTAYVIGTEACYGAKPVIKNGKEQSILMTALQNRCVGFLGSTQIAYGIPDIALAYNQLPSCADVLVGHFAECVAHGYPLGDAYLDAWKKLSGAGSRLEEIKTLCSFALYGDPTVQITGDNGKTLPISLKTKRIVKPSISISLKMAETNISIASAKSVESFVNTYFSSFCHAKPKYYKLSNEQDNYIMSSSNSKITTVKAGEEYKATYVDTRSKVTRILHVYFNSKGNVTGTFVSK